MKKVILTFGLISGVLSSLMMIATLPFLHELDSQKGYLIGYTAMVLSFLLVFFGIRSFRDNMGHGSITFGRAFTIGICITLISCVFYVITWEIAYFNFMHDSMQTYFAHMADAARAQASTPEVLQAKLEKLRKMQEMYENPIFNAAFTFIEPFPVGLVITLISAAILRRKVEPASAEPLASAAA